MRPYGTASCPRNLANGVIAHRECQVTESCHYYGRPLLTVQGRTRCRLISCAFVRRMRLPLHADRSMVPAVTLASSVPPVIIISFSDRPGPFLEDELK
jgi:hypothetical protein